MTKASVFVTLAVACAAALCASAASIKDVCTALKAVSLPPTTQQQNTEPDALAGLDISNSAALAWVSPSDCQPGDTTIKSTGDWVKNNELCLTKEVDGVNSCKDGQQRAVITATLDTASNTFTASVALEFSFNLVLTSGETVPVTGKVGFDVVQVPVELLGRVVPVWAGELSGTSGSKTVRDADLFDGVPAIVLTGSTGQKASADTAKSIQRIAEFADNMPLRLKFFDSVPSALSGDITARLAFPDPVGLLSVTADSVTMVGTNAIAAPRATCEDSECGAVVARILQNIAESDGTCGTAKALHVHGSTGATVVADTQAHKHRVVSAHAWVQGALECSAGGSMVVTLEALSNPDGTENVYDTDVFAEDARAATGMTKAAAVTLSGSRVALVRKDGHVYTTMEGNLFGFGRGGAFVDDAEISDATKSQFVSAVDDLVSAVATGVASLDSAVSSVLKGTKPDIVFDNYMQRTATPTGYGLWQYWAKQARGVEILMGDSAAKDTLVANVDLTIRSHTLPFSVDDPAYSKMNKALAEIHTQLGDSTLKAPVITEDTDLTENRIDGAVSASVSIPKLTSKIMLRAGTSPEAWAKATVAANFGANYSLETARLTVLLSTSNVNDAVIEYAKTGKDQQVVARTAEGALIKDEDWTKDQIVGMGRQLEEVASKVSEQLSTAAEQLRLISEGSDATFVDLVQKIADFAKSMQGSTKIISGFIEKLRDQLGSLVDRYNTNSLISSYVMTPDNNARTMDFLFNFFSIRHINADASEGEWLTIVPLERLRVQAPVVSTLHITASTSKSELVQFTQKASPSSTTGWALPVRSGMRPGVLSGSASLAIDFPDSAKLVIDASGKLERGGSIKAHFEGNLTMKIDEDSKETPKVYKWEFSESDRGDYAQTADEVAVANNFFDNSVLFQSILKYRLASPVPPFAASIDEFFDTSDLWTAEHAAFYTDSANPILASVHLTFPTKEYDEDYNVTVNENINKWCKEFNIPALQHSSQAEQAYNEAIENCGLSKYIVAAYESSSEGTEDDPEEGRVVFKAASPGIVYSFVLQSHMESTAPLRGQSWKAGQTRPDALSWNDLYDTVYALFMAPTNTQNRNRDNGDGSKYVPPVLTTVSVSDLQLVDESRAEFYPKQVPVVLFPISFRKEAEVPAVAIKTSFRSANLNTHFEISEDFSMPVAVTGEVSAEYGFALWSSMGDGSLNMTSSFAGNFTIENATVPDAPNNTFVIEFTYETRNKANVDATPALTTVSKTVTFKPGALIGDELLHIVSLFDDNKRLQRMLAVGTVVDTIREPVYEQVSLAFLPYVDEQAGTIDVPLSIRVPISVVPYWGSNETQTLIQTMTACAVTKDFQARFTVATAPRSNADATAACAGSTGIVDANATTTVASQQEFATSSANKYEFMANLVASAVDDKLFDQFFESVADIATTFDVTNFKFLVDRIASGDIASQVMRFIQDAKGLSFANLTSLVNSEFITDVIGQGASALALKSLSAADRKHVCMALTLANMAKDAYTESETNKEALPFSSDSLGPVFAQKLGTVFKTVTDNICSDVGDLTLDPVCKTLSKGWGVQACAEAAIEENALLLYVTAEPPVFRYETGFQFDVNRMIPIAKKEYPIGFGASSDLAFNANVSASFGIRFDFAAPSGFSLLTADGMGVDKNQLAALTDGDNTTKWVTVSLDPERTKFFAGANIDTSAHLKVSFGSVVLNFASAAIHLDAHVGAQWTKDKTVAFDIDGAASLQAGISLEPLFSCSVTASIPSLADFIMKRANATWTEDCGNGKSFLDQLDKATDAMNIAKYFAQDPSLFWKQFSGDIDKIFHEIINQLLNRAVAFIGKQLQGLIHKALDGITGPEVADLIGKEITDMVADIILNHTVPTGVELERIVLQVFTGILNRRFQSILKQEIPTPEPNPPDGRYVWAMVFGQEVTKPLSGIDFHLGGHGPAQFGLKCQPELLLSWMVQIDVVWTRNKGISIEWPDPAFAGEITLENKDCVMEGRLLYLGAVLNVSLDLSIAVNIHANGTTKKINALQFEGSAKMEGQVQLGLVGILKKKTDESIANSLPALPHVKSGILMRWHIDLRTDGKGDTTPFEFHFKEPELCLGTLLTGFMRRITDQLYKVIKPLLPVFGPDGILMKKIDVLKPLMPNNNDVLGILELMCKYFGSCNVNAVRKLCEIIREISDLVTTLLKFKEWLDGDDEGCARFDIVFRTFGINWTSSNPVPLDTGTGLALRDWDDQGQFVFPYNFDQNQKDEMQDMVSGWQTGGEFKFTLNILQGFPAKFIMILLGQNVPLFSMSFPSATFGFSTSWSIPVWNFPYIAIAVYASAQVTFRPPSIALMSNAVMDTIRTHDPSHIFRNLALSAKDDNGDPFYFAQGKITVGGGVEVGVSVFFAKIAGEATIGITFSAGIGLVSINNEQWTTIDQIAIQFRQFGLKGTVDIDLALTGNFRLALKACVNLIFKKKCWTLASKTWTFNLWKDNIKAPRMSQIADSSGQINGDAANEEIKSGDTEVLLEELLYSNMPVNAEYYAKEAAILRQVSSSSGVNSSSGGVTKNKYARYTITPNNVMVLARSQTDADAPRQHDLGANPTIRFTGAVCNEPISVNVVGDIAFPIQLPNCENSFLNVSQSNYDSSSDLFKITSTTITAGERSPITFTGKWESVLLSEASMGTEYKVSGMPPCPVTVETAELSELEITGEPADFGNRALDMTGALQSMESKALCSDFVIDLDHFTCTSKKGGSDGVNVRVPSTMRTMSALAQTEEETLFHIMATPKGRDVTLTSMTTLANFSVPDLATINGYTDCVGNSAGRMYLLATAKTLSGPAELMLTSSQAQLNNGDGDSHVVHHSNVPFREFEVLGATNQETTVKMLPPTEFDVVTVSSKGAAGSKMTHYVTGCHVRSGVQLRLEGGGEHTVIFGDKDGLVGAACIPSVVALKNSNTNEDFVSTVVINATHDARKLRWSLGGGMVTVGPREEQTGLFQVQYDKIDRVVVNFGTEASEVLVDTHKDSTEFVLNFQHPTSSSSSANGEEEEEEVQNTLQVSGMPAAVLVNGPVKRVVVGTPNSGTQAPFDQLGGVLAVASNAHIVLDTAHEDSSPDQHFVMDGSCITQKGTQQAPLSDWMKQQMREAGIEPRDSCSLLYNGAATQTLEVRTGGGKDSFVADGATIPVTLDMGGNADEVSLTNTADVPFVVDLGDGADVLTIDETGDVTADLGDDKLMDSVNVYYRGQSPNIRGKTVYPVGHGHAVLTIKHWLQQDMISVLRASDKRNLNSRFRADPVLIEASEPSTKLHYEQASDTTYLVIKCASMSTVAFDVHSSTSTDIAKNAWVFAAVEDYSVTCTLIVNSELAANGTVGVLVPDNITADALPRSATLSRNAEPAGTGSLLVGLVELRPTDVSHVEFAVPLVNGNNTGSVVVKDVPSGADLLVSVPTADWTVSLENVHSPLVVIGATARVSAQTLDNHCPVMVAGKSVAPPLYIDASSAQSIRYISGCMLTGDGRRTRTVSDWLVWRAMTQYGVWLCTQHQCSIETQAISTLYLSNIDVVSLGNLTKEYTDHVVLDGTEALNLTVDPAGDNDDDRSAQTTVWNTFKYEANATAKTNRLSIVRSDAADGQPFVIDMRATKSVKMTPGSRTKLAAAAPITLDCSAGEADAVLNLARAFDDDKVQLRAVMNVTSEKCSAVINNMLSSNAEVAPAVVLADGMHMAINVKTLPPLSLRSGRDEGHEEDEDQEDDEKRELRRLSIRTDRHRTKYVIAPMDNEGDESEEADLDGVLTAPSAPALVNASWAYTATEEIVQELGDNVKYVLDVDAQIIDDLLVRVNVSALASLAFGDLNGSTVLFTGASPSQFKASSQTFSLSPSGTDYCFDPCQDCTDGAWDMVVVSGKICQPRTAQDSCKARAKVVVNITGSLEGVSCGAASWASSNNGTCAFAMNVDGHNSAVLSVPEPIKLAATVVVAVSAGLTILGATSLAGLAVFGHKGFASMQMWWARNTFRDLLTDQFSWAAIVITACLPEAGDVDYASWGGPVVAIMLRAKTIVLNWFVACSDSGEPVWVTPATIVFWCMTGVSVVLRIVQVVLDKRNVRLSSPIENLLLAVQSYVTIAGFLLLPLVGYSLAFLSRDSYIGFASLACVLLLFLSQPIGKASRSCIIGISASVVNVLLPVGLCVYAGVGAKFVPLIAAALALTVVLPAIDMTVLWFAFFRRAVYRNITWKLSLSWTCIFRILSMLSGAGFLALLFFDLDTKMSYIAAGLWFGWVCAPYLSIVPLTLGVPSVLSSSELVSRKGYTEISNGSRSPVIGRAEEYDEEDDDGRHDDL